MKYVVSGHFSLNEAPQLSQFVKVDHNEMKDLTCK